MSHFPYSKHTKKTIQQIQNRQMLLIARFSPKIKRRAELSKHQFQLQEWLEQNYKDTSLIINVKAFPQQINKKLISKSSLMCQYSRLVKELKQELQTKRKQANKHIGSKQWQDFEDLIELLIRKLASASTSRCNFCHIFFLKDAELLDQSYCRLLQQALNDLRDICQLNYANYGNQVIKLVNKKLDSMVDKAMSWQSKLECSNQH